MGNYLVDLARNSPLFKGLCDSLYFFLGRIQFLCFYLHMHNTRIYFGGSPEGDSGNNPNRGSADRHPSQSFGANWSSPHSRLQSEVTYNPLALSVGSRVRLNCDDFSGLELNVEQILGTTIRHAGTRYDIVDYVLIGEMSPSTASLADRDGHVRVRLRCSEDRNCRLDVVAFQAQSMERDARDSFKQLSSPFQLATLRDSTGRFEYGFSRVGQEDKSYKGTRTVIGGPSTMPSGESHTLESLDFMRERPDASGGYYTQWALVEYNTKTKDMITLFGWSVDPDTIETVRS